MLATNAVLQIPSRRGSGSAPFSPDPRQPLKQPSASNDILQSSETGINRLEGERGTDTRMAQKYLAFSDLTPAEHVPPFIQFLRRNEEQLAEKVSQLSIMLSEAKGEHAAQSCQPSLSPSTLTGVCLNRKYSNITALTTLSIQLLSYLICYFCTLCDLHLPFRSKRALRADHRRGGPRPHIRQPR